MRGPASRSTCTRAGGAMLPSTRSAPPPPPPPPPRWGRRCDGCDEARSVRWIHCRWCQAKLESNEKQADPAACVTRHGQRGPWPWRVGVKGYSSVLLDVALRWLSFPLSNPIKINFPFTRSRCVHSSIHSARHSASTRYDLRRRSSDFWAMGPFKVHPPRDVHSPTCSFHVLPDSVLALLASCAEGHPSQEHELLRVPRHPQR